MQREINDLGLALTPEPDFTRSSSIGPEDQLQHAVEAQLRTVLERERAGSLVDYLMLPHFGLDLCVFAQWTTGHVLRLFELKVFTSASGRVGITSGNQVELLLHSAADAHVTWLVANAEIALGAPRYALFDSQTGRENVMGVGPEHGKQNNFKVQSLMARAIAWDELARVLLSALRPASQAFLGG